MDRHSIYVMAGGWTQEQVEDQVRNWVTSVVVQEALAASKASDDYILCMATNYEGLFLGYGYIYCQSPALYHILLGRQATGLEGVLVPGAPAVPYVPSVPEWGRPAERFDWVDATDRHHPERVLSPRPPLIDTDESIQLKPAHVLPSTQTRYMRVWSVPDYVTAQDLWILAIPYTSRLDVYLCRERNEALLVFPEHTYDANFAAYFLRKAVLDDATTLMFRPLRSDEPVPMYKNAERYPLQD